MSKRKKKEYDDDDGRVISPMNIDGMPWYTEKKSIFGGKKKDNEQKSIDDVPLTRSERRAMMGGVFAASLVVALLFALAGLLFILFCIYVWFD